MSGNRKVFVVLYLNHKGDIRAHPETYYSVKEARRDFALETRLTWYVAQAIEPEKI